MQALALTLSLALAAPNAAPGDAADAAAAPGETATATEPKAPSALRVWGVGLLAGGSAGLAVVATSAALVEALARPDDPDREPEDPQLMQGIAFGTMLAGAASLAAVLAGGAMVVAE